MRFVLLPKKTATIAASQASPGGIKPPSDGSFDHRHALFERHQVGDAADAIARSQTTQHPKALQRVEPAGARFQESVGRAGVQGGAMQEDSSEISLFDLVDWLWSFRWFLLLCVAMALAGAALAWQSTRTLSPSYEVRVQIFSGGTPVRDPAEIADILIAGLKNDGLALVSAQSANPIIFQTADMRIVTQAKQTVETLTAAIIEEVRAQEIELGRLLQGNETALPLYLRAKSFNEGTSSGLIPLIVTSIGPGSVSERSRVMAVIMPVLASGVFFFLVAGTLSFVRQWKNRRALG